MGQAGPRIVFNWILATVQQVLVRTPQCEGKVFSGMKRLFGWGDVTISVSSPWALDMWVVGPCFDI